MIDPRQGTARTARGSRGEPGFPERGFALITVLMLLAMLTALLAAHFLLTRAEQSTTLSSMDRTRGFYAAEAGLNLRAQAIRETFLGYMRPAGTSPADAPGQLPCRTEELGSGDFACLTYTFQDREVLTSVDEDPANPLAIVVPPDEPFENLSAQEYRYTVSSAAVNREGRPEAILAMRFKNRLVPLFQFAAFYNKDLEIYPGPPMTLDGPVHCNGDLYAGAEDGLTINGQVTVAHDGLGTGGRLFNGRKYDDCCSSPTAAVFDGSNPRSLPHASGRREVTKTDQAPWGGRIRSGLEPVIVPAPDQLDPGRLYWNRADVRIVLELDAGEIQVQDRDGHRLGVETTQLQSCPGSDASTKAVSALSDVYNFRESTYLEMLDVDAQGLLDCLQTRDLMEGKSLDDATDGGLVWYFGIDGSIPVGSVNNYAVRLREGAELASDVVAAPEILGLTVATNQAVYIQGDWNSATDNWKPSAFLADSINILSSAWDDDNSNQPESVRVAGDTAIYAAFLSGTDSTGGVEQSPIDGSSNAIYNGGLENYPRLHEDWTNKTLLYRGSFVSLDRPRHVDGVWDAQSYEPPDRDWRYELRFNNAANLPPLTPRFVYLTQELFVREFDY